MVEERTVQALETVREALADLASQRPLFHDEADFERALVAVLGASRTVKRAETQWPCSVGTVDACMEQNGARLAIELKYKTKHLDIRLGESNYHLTNHGALDQGGFDFWFDVSRLERLVERQEVKAGLAILLTNEHGYWKSGRAGTLVQAFRPYEGRRVSGKLEWPSKAAQGSRGKRPDRINLRGTYTVNWRAYSQIPEARYGDFRYLLAEVVPT